MLHLALHFLIPVLVAIAVEGARWVPAALVMIGTMLVDLDHLAADPVYDPLRCSIGFHPLHTAVPIGAYVLLTLVAGAAYRSGGSIGASGSGGSGRMRLTKSWRGLFYVGTGLVIHMALDGLDCLS